MSTSRADTQQLLLLVNTKASNILSFKEGRGRGRESERNDECEYEYEYESSRTSHSASLAHPPSQSQSQGSSHGYSYGYGQSDTGQSPDRRGQGLNGYPLPGIRSRHQSVSSFGDILQQNQGQGQGAAAVRYSKQATYFSSVKAHKALNIMSRNILNIYFPFLLISDARLT